MHDQHDYNRRVQTQNDSYMSLDDKRERNKWSKRTNHNKFTKLHIEPTFYWILEHQIIINFNYYNLGVGKLFLIIIVYNLDVGDWSRK